MSKLAVCLVALMAAPSFAGDPASDLTDEDRADLAWFEGLGYPKLGGKAFVRVRPGWGGAFRGFLVSDEAGKFRVVGLDLATWEFERTPPGTPEDRLVGYEVLDAEEVAKGWLNGGAGPTEPAREPRFLRDGGPTAMSENFVFACALARSADDDERALVHPLLAHVRTMRPEMWPADDPSKALRERVGADLVSVELGRVRAALARLGSWGSTGPKDRPEALAACRDIVRRFPGAASEAESRKLLTDLERMVREDEEHAKTAKPLEELTGDARVAELVFRLRDQQADGFAVMGGMGQITGGPYRELVAIGLPAVPRLKDALADDGPARCGSEGRGGWTPWVTPVGALAFDAIVEIAGRPFSPPADAKPAAPGTPFDPAAWRVSCRPAIEEWYAEMTSGREAESLARVVEVGDSASRNAAETLVKRYPDTALAAIAKGARAATDPFLREELVRSAAKLPGDAVADFLEAEMRTSPTLRPRVVAATGLLARRRDVAVAAILAEWNLRRDGKALPPAKDSSNSPIEEISPLVVFFVAAQDADAIRVLAEGLSARTVAVRVETIGCLAHALGLDWRWFHDGWWGNDKLTDPAAIAAAEEVVATALDDPSIVSDEVSAGSNERGFDVRFRDVAAAALAIRRGGAGPRLTSSTEQRDRETALVVNLWRKERGLAEIDVPAAPTVPRVADADIRPLLDAFVNAPYDRATVKTRLAAIDALGLGALAPIEEFLARGVKRPWDDDLRGVAGRLAFRVREVVVDPADARIRADLRERIESWRGRTVSGPDVAEFAADLVREAPAWLGGFTLTADRPGDGTGVVVTLRTREGFSGRPGYWTRVVTAIRGTDEVGPSSSHGSVVSPTAADFLADGADRPFSATPEQRAVLRIKLDRGP